MADVHLSNILGSPPAAPAKTAPEVPVSKDSETRVRETATTAPMVSIGFRRPEGKHPDDAALQVAFAWLADDREGMVGKELTRRNLTSRFQAYPNLPGRLRPSLLTIMATAARAGEEGDTEAAILEVVERLREAPLPEETVAATRVRLRMDRLRTMESTGGLARELARCHAEEGSWKRMIEGLDALGRVTAADVHRVARQYLGKEGRVVVLLATPTRNEP